MTRTRLREALSALVDVINDMHAVDGVVWELVRAGLASRTALAAADARFILDEMRPGRLTSNRHEA